MPARVFRIAIDDPRMREGVARIQAEQKVDPDFPEAVTAEAERAAKQPRLPDGDGADLTDVAFVTIDPPTSKDLDQALFLSRDGDGYVVRYAIADLAAFVDPGGPLDAETHRRGETLYGAGSSIPLHPRVLSEGAASLLPDEVRPAFVWQLHLDSKGALTKASVARAKVRSRAKLDYPGVQELIDSGQADESLQLLKTIGELRLAQEVARGGVSLPMPEQEIDETDTQTGGAWRLQFRVPLAVENWNAQISLLTGIAAAELMLKEKIGVVRTLPPAEQGAVDKLRRRAKALHVDWPQGQAYPEFVRSLDPAKPNEAAMVVACTSLLRGAGYAAFDGTLPEQTEHAALATLYAHVTAPLRRLVDRYGLEVCAALCAGEPVPDWARQGLADLPDIMRDADRRAHAYENATVDLVEALLLEHSVGDTYPGVVLEADKDEPTQGTVQIAEPAVEAPISSERPLPVGEVVTAKLASVDVAARKVAFTC